MYMLLMKLIQIVNFFRARITDSLLHFWKRCQAAQPVKNA